MKNLTFYFLVFTFVSFQLNAQNPHIKNTILGLEFHTYKTSDLGIKNAKNVVEMDEKKYTKKFDKDSLELEFIKKYKMQKERITNHHYSSNYYDSEYNFVYSKNFKVLQKQVYVKKKGYEEEVSFLFDNKNRVIEYETYLNNVNSSSRSKKYYDYKDANNTIEQYQFSHKNEKYKFINYKTDSKGNILERNIKASKYELNDNIRIYTYKGSLVTKIAKKEALLDVIKKGSKASTNYKYNENGLIIKNNGDFTESDFNFDHNYIYEYEYDKYGNWIVKYKFTTNYGYNDLKDENYKRVLSIILRKFTYKKGTITGNNDINASKIKQYLNNIIANNPFKTKKAPSKGTFWTRSSEKAIRLYLDGKYIGSQFNLLTILENDFYANDSINNKTYKLTDFKLKPENKAFYKATVFADNDEVVWFRSKEKSVKSYKNGVSLVSKLNFHHIYGDQFYINDSTTNTFYLLKDFMKKGINKEFHKAQKIAEQNEVVWIKLESGNYSIIKNGVNITEKTKMVFAKDKNDVLININDVPKYVMLNASIEKKNTFFKAMSYSDYLMKNPNQGVKEVIPNGFLWKKNKQEQFYIYENGKIDVSKIKVSGFYQHQFVYDITHNISYLLEDFDAKKIDEFYPITRLDGNAFFYKTSDKKLGIFINGVATDFVDSKYAENQIDVIAKAINSSQTYLLKNYKSLSVMSLGQVIIK